MRSDIYILVQYICGNLADESNTCCHGSATDSAILINFYTPLYNYVNPKFEGLPFFYWFQIMMLFIVVIPYLAFTYLAKRLDEEGGSS